MNHTIESLRALGNQLHDDGEQTQFLGLLLHEFGITRLCDLTSDRFDAFAARLDERIIQTATTVYKYPFRVMDGAQPIELPSKAEILSVGHDANLTPCLWAKVLKTDLVKVKKSLFVIGTGHVVPVAARKFLGRLDDGAFTWHVFSS